MNKHRDANEVASDLRDAHNRGMQMNINTNDPIATLEKGDIRSADIPLNEMNARLEQARNIVWALRDARYGHGNAVKPYAALLIDALPMALAEPLTYKKNYNQARELILEYERRGDAERLQIARDFRRELRELNMKRKVRYELALMIQKDFKESGKIDTLGDALCELLDAREEALLH